MRECIREDLVEKLFLFLDIPQEGLERVINDRFSFVNIVLTFVTLLSTTTTTTTATPPVAFPSATILAAIAWLSLPMVVGITRSKVIYFLYEVLKQAFKGKQKKPLRGGSSLVRLT